MGWFTNRLAHGRSQVDDATPQPTAAASPPSSGASVEADGPLWAPIVESDQLGQPLHGAGLDRIFADDHVLVVTGWTCGDSAVELIAGDGVAVPPSVQVDVPRPDVSAAHAFPVPVQGFLYLWTGPRPKGTAVRARVGATRSRTLALSAFPATRLEGDLARLLREYASARGPLFDALRDHPAHLKTIAWSASASARPGGPRGHLDILKVAPGAGGLCVGWSLGRSAFFLVDDTGTCVPLAGALRWSRPDIFTAFEADYGAGCAEAGFLQALPETTSEKTLMRLVAREGAELALLHERTVELAPLDAVGYARWAFSLPIPPERMVERFSSHDGAVLRRLIARSRADGGERAPVVRRIGPEPEAPEVSLLIPLFGRHDFVDHQLLEFADDPFITQRCEVIYIVDDPNIADPVLSSMGRWWQLHGVPLTVVWGGRNRGFSGANNLGLSVARGRQVLFLNSDVIPTTPGWLAQLSRRLDKEQDFGLVAPRLLFPSGGLQHDGMIFDYEPNFGIWINEHPGKGLPPTAAATNCLVEWPAATGACLLGRRSELLSLGGFSEIFLIGDFEDSDLCLKYRRTGAKIGICPDIALTHLERQSFGLIGSGDFRSRVMLFNAWQHQERWSDIIKK